MGDPEMPLWTQEPMILQINHPLSIAQETREMPVWVSFNGDGIGNATACIYREGECFEVVNTDANGQVLLDVPAGITGALTLTVTAPNCLPYQVEIAVDGVPDLRVMEMTFIDGGTSTSVGNEDNIAEPGETIDIYPVLKSFGSEAVNNVTAELSVSDPDITVITGTASYSAIDPQAEAGPDQAFVLAIQDTCRANRPVKCNLVIRYDTVEQTVTFNLLIAKPVLKCAGFVVYDFYPSGDGDAILEPGETAFINVMLENTGLGNAYDAEISIDPTGQHIICHDASVRFPDLIPGNCVYGFHRFWVSVADTAPVSGWMPQWNMTWQSDKYTDTAIDLNLPVGNCGFSDDVETTEFQWVPEGHDFGWSRSETRVSSGSWAWYCGSVSEGQYGYDMNCSLTSPEIYIAPGATLSLNRWFDFPMYGADGLNVEVLDGDQWIIIGFIGGGGALNMQSDWKTDIYELPVENVSTQIRLRFCSDSFDIAEGIYVDDIRVSGGTGLPWCSEPPVPNGDELACDSNGVTLNMPATIFRPGDDCRLDAWVCNAESHIVSDHHLFVILDVFGNLYFAPVWSSEPGYFSVDFMPGSVPVEILPAFTWPEGVGTTTGLMFWAGIVDPVSGNLFGDYDYWEFGWIE